MANQTSQAPQPRQQQQYTPEQIQAIAVAESARSHPPIPMAGRPVEEFRDPLALEAARVTPGVDDTPYIQYAIEQLTREREGEGRQSDPSSMSSAGQRYAPITSQPAPARPREVERQTAEQSAPLLAEPEPRPSSQRTSMSTLVRGKEKGARIPPAQPPHDAWQPIDPEFMTDGREKINPKLVFKPKILRPLSMITLLVLCLLMIAALIFSTIYSSRQIGLWPYTGTIYSGQYFLFRVVPAILAAIILFYAQCIVTTMIRMRPFARLAAQRKTDRLDAIFDDLYPKSFLRPHLAGPWYIWVPNLITWVMNMTLPLQSCLFTVVYVDGAWRWATVQGVAWTLVALYIALSAAIIIELIFWLKDKTGVMWDPRSIADVIAIIANSNTLIEYRGTEGLATRNDLRKVLRNRRVDRLAYWRWADHDKHDDLWYGLGYEDEWGAPGYQTEVFDDKAKFQDQYRMTIAERREKERLVLWDDIEITPAYINQVRYRYIPRCLSSLTIICSIAIGFFLLLALFVVSFLPITRITKGFLPLLSAAPVQGAFSAADFLYSFLPALLGLFLFMAFQDFDLHMRILQPWAELQEPPYGGALPESSILADYAACYPLQSTWHALRNRHWRLALISFFSTIFVFIPILAGGMFIALTPPDNVVRVFPQVPLFSVTLTLLVLYWLALVSLFPRRKPFRLPHAVTCPAEIISFVSSDDLINDEAFQGMIRNKTSLVGTMGVDRRDEDKPRWVLFTGGAGAKDERFGVRRVRKYTGPGFGEGARLMRQVSRATAAPSLGTSTLKESRREARRSERDVKVGPQYTFAPTGGRVDEEAAA
ncbi:hypothetical protein VM1G_09022 [Cytospora mali]|uniref:Phosphoribosylaminoimidazole-succinocarboxamide synthase n=1 Tax=Cytospora mali TaxID=578113 RepID=A0A194W9J7_CYTMA|nr:hypothetical protein VM1G_09022 [Valsa mali]